MNIADRVIKCIAKNLDLPVNQVSPTNSVKGDLGCDSLEVLEIAMALESEFSCSIDDDEALKLVTVQDIIDHLIGILQMENPAPTEKPYPTRQELIVAVASHMNVSAEKATKWLESEFAAGAA